MRIINAETVTHNILFFRTSKLAFSYFFCVGKVLALHILLESVRAVCITPQMLSNRSARDVLTRMHGTFYSRRLRLFLPDSCDCHSSEARNVLFQHEPLREE